MAENQGGLRIFGWEIRRSKKAEKDAKEIPSVIPPSVEDGDVVTAAVGGGYFGTYVDLDGEASRDDNNLIQQYRVAAQHPEVDAAIEDIISEAVASDVDDVPVQINLDRIEGISKTIAKQVHAEFDDILGMLNFRAHCHDLFKRWYIDGRMVHHLIIDEKNPKRGIQEIRPIDATKVRKIKQVKKTTDAKTGFDVIESVNEFFVYSETDEASAFATSNHMYGNSVRLTADSVSYVTSGLLDARRKRIVSHIHKALKPINQLRMMEDALVIYRLARAPERRIFYVDVGNLPAARAEAYMKNIQNRYRNKLVYDAETGVLRDDRKHMSMLEDFWLPRREGGRGTEIDTLPGGDNLGEIEDIEYFQRRLYRALNVPLSRLEQDHEFAFGRVDDTIKDEVKFQKFIDRLRNKFNDLFVNILRKQLLLKGIITEADWAKWLPGISFDYARDNYFAELKEAELVRERLDTLSNLEDYIGKYFSHEYVMKKVLRMTETEIAETKEQITAEKSDEFYKDEEGGGRGRY